MLKKFDFEDINLEPNFCVVGSRSECDTSVTLGKWKFKMPVVPANMECVIDEALAIKLAQNGYFYIMHRFDVDVVEFVTEMKKMNLMTSISIGVNKDSFNLIETLVTYDVVPDFITIDIAHGHSVRMKEMLEFIKQRNTPLKSFIIAGNVSTIEGAQALADWGADCVKVGIGPGSACTTWPTTGFGSRNCQASTVFNCSKVSVPIIADGGIRTPSDIAKSLVLGSTMVMVGGMLSGFQDSPGSLVNINGVRKKEFWGSASASQSGKTNRIEGTKILVDYRDVSILEEMQYLKECLQSSISYAGGKNLDAFLGVKWF